jgi:hypothetical protein
MTGHRTDGNHGPGSNPSKLRTLATKKSRCWRNQAITLTENLAIRSHLMSLGIPPELRQAGSYLFARRISPDKRISSVLDFLTRCRLPITNRGKPASDHFSLADSSFPGLRLLRFRIRLSASGAVARRSFPGTRLPVSKCDAAITAGFSQPWTRYVRVSFSQTC